MLFKKIFSKILVVFLHISIIISIIIPIVLNSSSNDTAKKVALKTIDDIKKYKTELEGNFPGYYDKLLQLKQNNSNWTFTLYYTGIEWNTAIYNETEGYHGRSLVQGKVGDWICPTCNEKVYDGSDWLCSSKEAVRYLMDVRNYLYESTIFQFEKLSYDPDLYSISGINKVLKGTFMYEKNIAEYYNKDIYENITFAEAIMNAATKSGVSPYYLAARIRQEVGISGSGSTSGVYKDYEGYFNFYNIGANAGTNPIANGLYFAKNKAGSYLGPWNTPVKSIEGGAIWIAKNYISSGQDTLYFQKFDVVSNGTVFFNHQYMQNIFAARNEGITTYNTYKSLGLLDNNYNFIIPLYKNMPQTISKEPKVTKITGLNEKVQVKTTVNLRTNPTTTSNIITKLQQDEMLTRTEKYVTYANGYYWDKVKLSSDTVGYVATNYITTNIKNITNDTNVSNIVNNISKITISASNKTLGVKEKYQINYSVIPKNESVTFSSSNNNVATVNKNGKVTARKKGTAYITAKINDEKTAKIKIIVKKAPTKITLNAKSKTIKKNKTFNLKAKLSSGSAGKITYSSSNSKIAKVNSKGKITAKKKGTTYITAKTYNGKKAKIKIKVK